MNGESYNTSNSILPRGKLIIKYGGELNRNDSEGIPSSSRAESVEAPAPQVSRKGKGSEGPVGQLHQQDPDNRVERILPR